MQYIIKTHGNNAKINESMIFDLYEKLIQIKDTDDVVLITPTGSLKFFTKEDIDDVTVDFTLYSNAEVDKYKNEDAMCFNYDIHGSDVIIANMMLLLNRIGLVR